MQRVAFITTESGTDLIVSFAIEVEPYLPGDVKSLTLLRTPKFEFALDESQRGPSVSYDDLADEDFDRLESVELERSAVRIRTQRREYALDTRGVNLDEMRRAAEILHKMNFDDSFLLKAGSV